MANIDEQLYLSLLDEVIRNGNDKKDRTGIGTKSIFGTTLKFSLENNTLPMLTSKKMFARGVIEELLFFIRGETNTKILEEKNVNIWKGNTSREFLDKRGLTNLPEGDMGKGYGYQWRSFGKSKTNEGTDQLKDIINLLKNDPDSRRIIISAWNPNQLSEMSLPPCHIFMQLYVSSGELSAQWYQRSVDCGLGLPFNIMSYSIFTHILAATVGLKAKELTFVGGDTHVYNNHIDQLIEQISRRPYKFPTIHINKDLKTLEDIEQLNYEDFEIKDYHSYPPIKMDMAI